MFTFLHLGGGGEGGSTDPCQGKSTALVRISGNLTCEPAAAGQQPLFWLLFLYIWRCGANSLEQNVSPYSSGIVHRHPLLERGFGFASLVALHNVDCT